MVKEGIPFVIVPAFIAVLFVLFGLWPVGVVFILLALFMAYFFRDPQRTVPAGDDIIVSAADGRVTRIDQTPEATTVSVFLSPFDVHINRSPIAGKVEGIEYIRGKKAPATSDEASFSNERNSLVLANDKMTVTCTQIAGIVARRIVCWARPGDQLELGQRFGLIKFSSRTDLRMPSGVQVEVKVGDRVVGGETIIARLVER